MVITHVCRGEDQVADVLVIAEPGAVPDHQRQVRAEDRQVVGDRLGVGRPDLASAGRDLLYQFGVGLVFLSTVRPDGGPRLHPVCPVLVSGRLMAHIIPSPKRYDCIGTAVRAALVSEPG